MFFYNEGFALVGIRSVRSTSLEFSSDQTHIANVLATSMFGCLEYLQ